MNAWIILLFLLMNRSGGCNTDNGCDREPDCGRGRNQDFGGSRERDCDRDRDCDCDDRDRESRFEPRFEARPFVGRETCGCEENNNA
ncbi:MAG: hypothetical protein NC318_04885 [Blautia sp.]|nr:hypothetical protein [Lachnoclostridium sp.]MCM1210918.1 hypothetical protein [Blautia sp.]